MAEALFLGQRLAPHLVSAPQKLWVLSLHEIDHTPRHLRQERSLEA